MVRQDQLIAKILVFSVHIFFCLAYLPRSCRFELNAFLADTFSCSQLSGSNRPNKVDSNNDSIADFVSSHSPATPFYNRRYLRVQGQKGQKRTGMTPTLAKANPDLNTPSQKIKYGKEHCIQTHQRDRLTIVLRRPPSLPSVFRVSAGQTRDGVRNPHINSGVSSNPHLDPFSGSIPW